MNKEFLAKVCVVGLGYVGLPLTIEFAKNGVTVCGFDINRQKINQLNLGLDPCGQIKKELLEELNIPFSDSVDHIKKANFIIISVPTPIDKDKKPDLSFLEKASFLVGANMSPKSIVVYESTVYPGVTEEVCLPVLEKASGLKCGKDFYIGYSPERVNPGDDEHTIDKIVKVVAGMDEMTTELIAKVYGKAIKAGIFKAKSIKVAEAAKVIENIQRDLNIALVNEFAIIFEKLGISTNDVMEAASTKWNFHRYHAGLVGGHCIGVDPYYLVHKAQSLGYDPQLLLAGRRINESMAKVVAERLVKMMIEKDLKIKGARVLIMGLTFKENINDVRNSKAEDIIKSLHEYGMEVLGFEPHVGKDEIRDNFGIENVDFEHLDYVDAIILFNGHKVFREISLNDLSKKFRGKPILFDVKDFFDKAELKKLGFSYAGF